MQDTSKINIGKSEDFIEGKVTKAHVGFVECAVSRVNGELGCITNKCVHKEGPLCDGWITGCKVVCPWHYWEFDYKTGQGDGKESQGSYKIWEEDGEVYVDATSMQTERKDYPAI